MQILSQWNVQLGHMFESNVNITEPNASISSEQAYSDIIATISDEVLIFFEPI